MAPSQTSVFTPMAAELPPGITDSGLASILVDVAADGVAMPSGRDQQELEAVVDQARSEGIALSIVVVPGNPGHDSNLRDLAIAVGKQQGGTVVVLSDDWVGTSSDAISRVKLEWAEDAAKGKQGDSVEAATIFVGRLAEPETVPWSAISGVFLAGTVLAVGGLYWVKARRARTDEDPARPGMSNH